MTIFGRPQGVPSSPARCQEQPAPSGKPARKTRQKVRRQEFKRRALFAECLEERAVMDGAGLNLVRHPFWNINSPKDVNADGRVTAFDAIRIINELNLKGAHSLANGGVAAGNSGGEAGQSPSAQGFLDVNNDNFLSAMDALTVINQLNSAGEGEPMMSVTAQVVASGTNTDLTTITKGGFYEVRLLTQDFGLLNYMGKTRPADDGNGNTLLGVQTAFFDLDYETNKTSFQVNEVQNLLLGGTVNEDGTGRFRITVNDGGTLKTTADITVSDIARSVTARNMQVALNTLLGANTVEVTNPSGLNFRIRFLNRLADRDMPEVTAAASANMAGATFTVTETIKGLPSNAAAVTDAFKNRPFYTSTGTLLTPASPFYQDQRGGITFIDGQGIDNLGGTQFFGPYPGAAPVSVEIARFRFNANDAGTVNFNIDFLGVPPGLETGVVGFPQNPISIDLITVVNDTITITEPLSAGDDTATTTEGSTTPIDIVVTTNDVNNAPTPNTTKSVQSVILSSATGTATLGSAVVKTGTNGTTITYTPPGGDFSGTDVFRYIVQDQNGNTDTATVTVTINPVNDPPVIAAPATQSYNEDVTRVFSTANGNPITVTDVDAASGTLTMTLNVGAGNGTLTLATLSGLTGTTGNGTSTITTTGTLAALNAALDGLSYVPTTNLSGPVTLAVTVNDNGNTGGAAQQTTQNIAITLNAVNDAPIVNLAGYTIVPLVVEGDPLVLNSANSTLIQVGDVDAGSNSVLVTLNVSAGNTILVNATPGVTIGTNGTNNVTLTGTVANINTALNGITYTAAIGFGPANETLQITINDQGNTGSGGPLSDSKNVTIAVDPATRPRARADVLTVNEDSTAGVANTVDVLVNDLVNLPGPPTVKARLISFSVTSANGGTVTLDNGGTPGVDTDDKLIYVPAANFFGTDTFTYVMNDTTASGADSQGTVTVTVREANDAPDAVNDSLSSIAEDSGDRTILASTLFANDSKGPNESAQTLAILSVGSAVGGTVALNGSGDVVFSPTLNYNGPASFTYTVTDNGTTNGVNDFLTDTATVTFTITEVNDVPTASSITLANIAEDSGTYVIPISTLLASVSPGPANESGQTLTLNSVLAPNGGTVAIVGSNVEFTPTPNFNGASGQRFVIEVFDNGTTNGAPAPLNVTTGVLFAITPVNDAPVAVADTGTTGEEQQIIVSVIANDRDVDVNPPTGTAGQLQAGTTVNIISGPTVAQGTATVNGSNQIVFTPAAGFFGQVTITYQLNDNNAPTNLSNIASLVIDVVERNDPPVANPDPGIVTPEDTTIAIDVFGNDTDPDTAKANWSFIMVTPPLHGTAVFNTTTRVVDYTPASNYNGSDSFVYRINDNSPINPQNLTSGTALVSINVTEVNDAPTANDDYQAPPADPFIVVENRDRQFTSAQLLANDSPGPANESSQSLTITGVTQGTNGAVSLVSGVITYTPTANFTGTDSFTYTITDNGTTAGAADPKTSTATVRVNVVSFIPTDVVGYVFRDVNGNGTYQVGIDLPLAGVTVTLSGTSDITGAIAPIPVETNADGLYQFLDVEPGTYTLTESQPLALADGPETLGLAASFAANDQINLLLPLLGVPGETSTNNFAEGGIDASKLTNSSGLASELLASSTNTGMVLATTLAGSDFWSWALNGWAGCDSLSVTLDPDKTAATLVATHNGTSYTTRIFQNPNDVRNANRFNSDPVAKLARFRILGWDSNNNYIIRLDGTAEHFYGVGSPLAFQAPPMSGGEYVEGVDAAMAEESWA